jgi:hypothetical protein
VVVPLDSPRWKALGGEWAPDLIRLVSTETTPNYREGGQWWSVYSDLYHQHSIYPVTYAAFPHLVSIADEGTVRQRMAVLCLAGNIRVHSHTVGTVPGDLLPDFEAAMNRVKGASLPTVREAVRAAATDEGTALADLLEAAGGLRHPKSGFVTQLGHLVREGWQVEPTCLSCRETMVAELREPAITTVRLDGRGHTLRESARMAPVDRSGYPGLLAAGRTILARGDVDWALQETSVVLAALADECGDSLLAARILDLGSVVPCAYCGGKFELSHGLQAL